jgi:signal transduction histidine kinase
VKFSLKKRLLGILLGLTLFAWVSSAVLTFSYASGVMLDQVDRQLEQYAELVNYITQIFARQVDEGPEVSERLFGSDFDHKLSEPMMIDSPGGDDQVLALNVFLDDRLIATLENSPRFDQPVEAGFAFRRLADDSHWRVRSLYDEPTGLWIQVGIEIDGARWAMLGILGQALFPLLIVMPLTIALFYYGVSRGLRPLQDLASQISRRSPGLLDPVSNSSVPNEMQPVVAELNDLLERLAKALEGEQRFTANAAHELMTPLAAIKTEVQLCQRQMVDAQGQEMLQRIALRVDRASHSVEQLMTLARVDPDAPRPTDEVNLESLITEVLVENAHLAADRHLEVDLQLQADLSIKGNAESLAILLRNLLVNAFRYASDDSTVTVSLQSENAGCVVKVSNDCKPLSAEEYRRIGERFYRVPGSVGLGAGLGLSIVNRVADQHGARFEAAPGEDGSGFCAKLIFPG